MDNSIRIVFTDLDGTLLNSEKKISPLNLQCLHDLGEKKITRVIATGRSLYSFQKLFTNTIPVDYLIFSTGAGVMDLQSEELLHSSSLSHDDSMSIADYLIDSEVDFMVHHDVPHNHHFTYYATGATNPDFYRRIELYSTFAEKYTSLTELPPASAQVIAIFPEDLTRFNQVRDGLTDFQLTRTTSPLDGQSIWLEIFPRYVSKGYGADWLCNHLCLERNSTLGIGNDYNDISLLRYTQHSFVVENAPLDLKEVFQTTRSNNENGFYHAANLVMQDHLNT